MRPSPSSLHKVKLFPTIIEAPALVLSLGHAPNKTTLNTVAKARAEQAALNRFDGRRSSFSVLFSV